MTEKAGKGLVLLILIGMVLQLGVIGYTFVQSYNGRAQLVESQRAGCERGKLDRRANAAFQRAHTRYIQRVTGAASVQEDVKRAAREARTTFRRTSKELTERSQIVCAKAFPKASLLP